MFCKNCGKDIGDAKFCQYCGYCNNGDSNSMDLGSFFEKVRLKIKKIGHDRLINIVSLAFALLCLVIRIVNNEIVVVYHTLLVQDDYYAISESAIIYALVLMVVQVIISVFLYSDAKRQKVVIPKSIVVLSIISLLAQILMVFIKVPAPY